MAKGAKGRKVGRWKNSPYGKRYTGMWKSRKRNKIMRHLKQHPTDAQSEAAVANIK